MPPLQPRRPGRAVTKFNTLVPVILVGLLGLLLASVMLLQAWLTRPTPVVAKEVVSEPLLKLPEVITRTVPRKPVVPPPPPPPPPVVESGVADPPPPAVVSPRDVVEWVHPLPPVKPTPAPQGTPPPVQSPPTAVPPPPLPKVAVPQVQPPKLPKQGWEMLARGKEREKTAEPAVPRGSELVKQGGAEIIKPARWAMPQEPLRTLYRSQTLPGRLAQAMSSDIPGQVKIELTVPVFDKFGYETVILPKGTLIIATQEGAPQHGATRIAIRLDQIELPSGEVIVLEAKIGDEEGRNGLTGHVNNHTGKLLLATGLSAILNIGVRSAVGTPGFGQFYQTPLQEAGRDVGQDVQQSAKSVIDRQLRIPPTITVPAGTFVTINLSENITFARPPFVAR